MGSREMFFVLGATVLFGVLSFSATMTMMSNNEMVWESECRITALSIAQQYLEEAQARPFFDAALAGGVPTNIPGDFTSPAGLGPGDGEYYPLFNDIDDYNGFQDTVGTTKSLYFVNIAVYYVEDTAPSIQVNYRTLFKKMDVEVSFYTGIIERKVRTSMVFGYY